MSTAVDRLVTLFALGVLALGGALAFALGYVLAALCDRAVPLLTCATHKRHDVLSRPEAGRTAMPTPRPGVQNWTPTPGLEATPPPASATPPAIPRHAAPGSVEWVRLADLYADLDRRRDVDEARRYILNTWAPGGPR